MKGSHHSWLSRSKGILLTFGLGIIILQGVSSRKSLAGVNIMTECRRRAYADQLVGIDSALSVAFI
jgi:hypothetical protein